jgi:hypothetical protein
MLLGKDEILKDLLNTLIHVEQELWLLKNQMILKRHNGTSKDIFLIFQMVEKWFSLIEVGIIEHE